MTKITMKKNGPLEKLIAYKNNIVQQKNIVNQTIN